jgi:hypothetical protein
VGVLLAQHILADGQALLEKRQGLGMLGLMVQAEAHVVVAAGGVGVLLAQHLLADGEGLVLLFSDSR